MADRFRRPLILALVFTVLVCIVLLVLTIYFAVDKDETTTNEQLPAMPSITVEKYGQTDDGQEVLIYTLKNGVMEAQILNFGGTLVSVKAPDRNGHVEDVVLGFDSFDEYKTNPPYFGGLIGRYANRIAKGHFTLDGVTYNLTVNNGPNALHGGTVGFDKVPYFGGLIGRYANRIAKGHFTLDGITYNLTVNNGPNALHGGTVGFDKRIWDSSIVDNTLVLTYVSADMEEGYPGQVTVTVTYKLSDENALVINYNATTTKTTVINLTNHAYFNLAKQNAGTLANHNIRIQARSYTPVDNTSIPTGVIAPVEGTKFDLTSPNMTNLGTRLPEVPGDIGFDHNFVFGQSGWDGHTARVVESTTGRTLDVYSTQPGVQFYTAFYLNGTVGKGGYTYQKFGAFCLETQHYPDSPNQPSFPTTVLQPGEVYRHTTRYVFGTDN